MGKMITKGKATRKLAYDQMRCSVKFVEKSKITGDALAQVEKECDQYLDDLQKLGFQLAGVKAEQASVQKVYDPETNGEIFQANRKIYLETGYSNELIDTLMKAFQEHNYHGEISFQSKCTKQNEVEKELVNEAVADARKMAEVIADSTGTEIKGFSRIRLEENDENCFDEKMFDFDEVEHNPVYYREKATLGFDRSNFAELGVPETEITKSVAVEWILE